MGIQFKEIDYLEIIGFCTRINLKHQNNHLDLKITYFARLHSIQFWTRIGKEWRPHCIMHYGTIVALLVLLTGCFAQDIDDGSGTREDEIDTWGNVQVFQNQ